MSGTKNGASGNVEDSSTDNSTDDSGELHQDGDMVTFGGIDTEKGKHLDKAQQDEIKDIGKKLNQEVVFEDFYKLEKFKGKKKVPDGYLGKDGKVHINYYAKRPVQFLLKHEITHYLKRKLNDFAYQDFMGFVFKSKAFTNWMHSKGFSSMTELKRDVYDRYSEVKNFNEEKCFDEILADFVGDYLFGGENAVSQKLINALGPKQKKTFMETIKDILSHIKQIFSEKARQNARQQKEISDLEDRFLQLYNEAVAAPVKENSIDDSSEMSYSYPDEFSTNVMQWAYSASTKPGDVKIFNTIKNGFALLEKTEDGYVEIARGDYKEVKIVEQSYRKSTDTVYVHTAMFKNGKTRNSSDNNIVENNGEFNKSGEQVGGIGLQGNTARNIENLRSSDKGKSEIDSQDSEDYSIPAASNTEELLEAYENGEISHQEYLETIKKKKP